MKPLAPLGSLLLDRTPRQLFHFLLRRARGQARCVQFDERYPALFVLSTGRTGTETLAALLDLVPTLAAHHEPSPLLYALSCTAYRFGGQPATDAVLEEAFLTARRELLAGALGTGRGYVETSPQLTFLAPAIHAALPGARFIHLVRDPRNVVRSAMRRRWYDGNPHDGTRITPQSGTAAHALWGSFSAFQKNLWLWHETNRWLLTILRSLPLEQTLQLHSEALFAADGQALSRLFRFAGAEMPPTRNIERVLGKQLNAQQGGSFPPPADWDSEMVEQLHAIAGETATALGYAL